MTNLEKRQRSLIVVLQVAAIVQAALIVWTYTPALGSLMSINRQWRQIAQRYEKSATEMQKIAEDAQANNPCLSG